MNLWKTSILLLCFISSSSFAFGETPHWDFEYMLETCGSLEKYESEYMMCSDNGYSYSTIEVRYYTRIGEEVILEVKQAKSARQIWDSHIVKSKLKTACGECSISSKIREATQGLADAANNETFYTRQVSSESANRFSVAANGWNKELAKDILTGLGINMTYDGAKNLLQDRVDDTNSGATVMIKCDSEGKPVGSGYYANGTIQVDVELVGDSNQRIWTGTVDTKQGYNLVGSWGGYSSGGMTCKTSFSGTNEKMTLTISCTNN